MYIRLFFFFLVAALAANGCGKKDSSISSGFDQAAWEQQLKNPNLTEDEFTSLFAEAAAAKFKDAKVTITGKQKVSVKFADGLEQNAFLDNAWADVANSQTDRMEIVQRYLKLLSNIPATGLPDTNKIVPVIRDEAYVQQFAEMGATTTNRIVSELLTANLYVVYAIDGNGTITFLREDDRQQLGYDLAALRKLAIHNLRQIMPEFKRIGDGPAYMLVANGDYESSLLLADNVWENEAKSVEGDIVAAVPARDMLIFTGSQSPDGIKKLKQMVEEAQTNSSHLISNTILIRRNGRWEKYTE